MAIAAGYNQCHHIMQLRIIGAGGVAERSLAVLHVLRVPERCPTWGNRESLEGLPDGWPVLRVLILSNSLSARPGEGEIGLQHGQGPRTPTSVAALLVRPP
jgi:hypothetical protein